MSHLKSKYLMLISLIIILIIFSSCSLIFEQVKTPIFNPEEGTFSDYISVEIYSATANATITYTTDGSTPTQNHGTIYTKPITIYKTTTIKAIAYKNLMNDSSVATATFTINKVAPVKFSPIGGYFNYPQLVTISGETEGATIKYTINNSDPSPTNGTTYNGSIEIASNITLKAIAYKDGMANSDIVIANYNISNPSGSLDTSFGVNGISINSIGNGNDNARSVAIQSDGKIVVVGDTHNGTNYDIAVVRYIN